MERENQSVRLILFISVEVASAYPCLQETVLKLKMYFIIGTFKLPFFFCVSAMPTYFCDLE